MKFRFSLRVLLIATVMVAGAAAFVALRMQPAKIAARFQRAVQRDDQSAETMIAGEGIEETLRRYSHLKDPRSWKFVSCDVSEQSTEQWLRGVCVGQFVVEFYFKYENAEGGSSAYQTCYYDVAISSRGVEIVKFSHDEPAVAVWDNSMLPAEDAATSEND